MSSSSASTRSQSHARMAAADRLWADTVLMLYYTRFQITAFLTLTRFSYHPDGNYLQGGLKTADGRNCIVPVHPKIHPWLAQGGDTIVCLEDGKPVLSGYYRKRFADLMAEIGAEGTIPHWCRHTFASRLHHKLAVKRILGHSDKDITEYCTYTDLEYLRKEFFKVS